MVVLVVVPEVLEGAGVVEVLALSLLLELFSPLVGAAVVEDVEVEAVPLPSVRESVR